ncbi:OmpH family outer membrane protein [Alphaproteobacteria bacterium]|nr:OmpH family outer membrane protein [Alphaproteobacteria bacterium]
MMKKTRFTTIKLLVCMMVFIGFAPASFAQTDATTSAAEKSMEVKRIALVDLDGVLRAADANNRVRELLDGQRAKFQEEFRAIEVDLQQSERDLLAKRDLIAKDEYDKLVTAFQARVSSVQKEIQYKRQSIDNAYQKALSDIRKLAIDVITKIASERKIDLILNRDSSVIFLPHLNISDEVLSRLNERTKNARIEVEIKKPVAQ